MINMDIKYEVTIKDVDPMTDKKIKESIAKILKENGYNSEVNYDSHNMTMMTDFYEMTMGEVNNKFKEYDKIDYYDAFFRVEPLNAKYGVVFGVDKLIKYIKEFHFTDEDIEFLREKTDLSDDMLNYLRHLQFTGDIYGMPDGTIVFRNEPFITVRAPRIQCKLIETAILAIYNSNIAYMTAASKITNAAGNIPVMSFGSRRAYGLEAAVDADIAALTAGCVGTSNVKAAQATYTKPLGTMAHSGVMEANSEKEAFRKYARTFPNSTMLLVDTYDTLNGTKVAIDACVKEGVNLKGIRIDSGNLAELSKEAKKIMNEYFKNAKVCLSNGLTAEKIEELKNEGAVMDTLGVGDNISAPEKRVGAVYKLCAVEDDGKIIPKIKLSGDAIKTTNPGYKKVYRLYDKNTGYMIGDIIALADEVINKNYTIVKDNEYKEIKLNNYNVRELQTAIFKDGNLVYDVPTMEDKKEYFKREMEMLPNDVKATFNPKEYRVFLSNQLRELKDNLIENNRCKVKKKVR